MREAILASVPQWTAQVGPTVVVHAVLAFSRGFGSLVHSQCRHYAHFDLGLRTNAGPCQ